MPNFNLNGQRTMRNLRKWQTLKLLDVQWWCKRLYCYFISAIQTVTTYIRPKSKAPLAPAQPWCPSEKFGWAQLRVAQLHAPPQQPVYRAPDAPRFRVLNDIIPRCISIDGAPTKLIAFPPLTPTVPQCLEREKALWVIQLDKLCLGHVELVELLMFANYPGSMVIALSRDATVTCVALQCGFKTVWAQHLSNITPAANSNDNLQLMLWVRVDRGPVIRGTGACVRSPRTSRIRCIVMDECDDENQS